MIQFLCFKQKTYLILGWLFLFFVLVSPSAFAAQKKETVSQYLEVSAKLKRLQSQGYSVEPLLGELDQLIPFIADGNFEKAGKAIERLNTELEAERRRKLLPYGEKVRTEWLEIYSDIFQKFTFIILSAYLLIRQVWFRHFFTKIKSDRAQTQAFISVGVLTGLGAVAAGLGYLRFGEADWAFLDLQVVFTILIGILGGSKFGMISAVFAGIFRWMIGSGRLAYFIILIAAGLIGSGVSKWQGQKMTNRRVALLAGVSGGLLHGIVIYRSFWNSIDFSLLSGIIFSLAILESLALYVFVAVCLGAMEDDERKKLEKLLPEMKLKFLQAQINPHFLFNTLNTIAAICSREKAEQARELVVKLSNYFRRIVKREDECVTLEEELKYIDSYLEIEKARYQDSLKIHKDIRLGPRGLKAELPVLIIQPMVENAIRHGLAPKSGGGILEISACENGKVVEIIVKDNGVGIEPRKLKLIQTKHYEAPQDGHEAGSGIGLRNINERLKYHFGEPYQLTIQSEAGVGTVIRFDFPIENEKEE